MIDLIHGMPQGARWIRPVTRLLQDDLVTPLQLQNPRDITDPSNAEGLLKVKSLERNTGRDIQMQAQIEMRPELSRQLNTLRTVARIGVQFCTPGFSEVLLDVPMGTFRLNIPEEVFSKTARPKTVTCFDLTYDISKLDLPDWYTLAAGDNYVGETVRMATQGSNGTTPGGCPYSGPGWPASRVQLEPDPTVTVVAIPNKPGTNVLNMMNATQQAVTHEKVWTDPFATLMSRRRAYYTDRVPTPEWTYDNLDQRSILLPGTNIRLGEDNFANVVQVICENNGSFPFKSILKNESLASFISIPNVGREVWKTIQDDKIPSQELCDDRCFVELALAAIAEETVEFSTAINPFHVTFDALSLNLYLKDGSIYVDARTHPFLETAWQVSFDTRTMRHTAGRHVLV